MEWKKKYKSTVLRILLKKKTKKTTAWLLDAGEIKLLEYILRFFFFWIRKITMNIRYITNVMIMLNLASNI